MMVMGITGGRNEGWEESGKGDTAGPENGPAQVLAMAYLKR